MSFPDAFYRWRPHPWHGLEVGPDPPRVVNAYVEITPFDTVKYEVDKVTGYLRVDRPQPYSSQPPTLYGFVPRTFCGPKVAALTGGVERADGDPLDICVVSERPINRAETVLSARVVGGIETVDRGEADDKLVAVLNNDLFWGGVREIGELPEILVDRLRHYFHTYKRGLGEPARVEVGAVYGRERAERVVAAAMEDYREVQGGA